jgi:hypothetical protein
MKPQPRKFAIIAENDPKDRLPKVQPIDAPAQRKIVSTSTHPRARASALYPYLRMNHDMPYRYKPGNDMYKRIELNEKADAGSVIMPETT